jgi:hypothetical protein
MNIDVLHYYSQPGNSHRYFTPNGRLPLPLKTLVLDFKEMKIIAKGKFAIPPDVVEISPLERLWDQKLGIFLWRYQRKHGQWNLFGMDTQLLNSEEIEKAYLEYMLLEMKNESK